MGRYILSVKADRDLDDIADYSLREWGLDQTSIYLTELIECLQWIADQPELGRSASEYSFHLKKYNFKVHCVFYEPIENGVLIVRILGQVQDFGRHL